MNQAVFKNFYSVLKDSDEEFNSYTLDYPNREVKQSLEQLLLAFR